MSAISSVHGRQRGPLVQVQAVDSKAGAMIAIMMKRCKGVLVQVHPVVSRLCAPIEGTDAAHLADCLGLDPAKFRQQVMASSSDAREEAQLAAASVFDDDDRYKVSIQSEQHLPCSAATVLPQVHELLSC